MWHGRVRLPLQLSPPFQADEVLLMEELADLQPDSTTKNLRRHTIQLPSPALFLRLSEIQQYHPAIDNPPIDSGAPSVSTSSAQGGTIGIIGGERVDEESEEGQPIAGRPPLLRIPRQITQPELGSWRQGLQRESRGTGSSLVAGEVGYHQRCPILDDVLCVNNSF